MKKLFRILTLALIIFTFPLLAGNEPVVKGMSKVILNGRISDMQSQESLAGVRIVCSQCSNTFYTDLNGNFFIYLEINAADKIELAFSQVGYVSKSVGL